MKKKITKDEQPEFFNVAKEQSITRTHRAFGLFPNALLLSGYGTSEGEKERSFTIMEQNAASHEVIERRFEMFTKSEMGLPRGRDPHVLVGLLKLLFVKDGMTNSVWFRKSELLHLLGWTDNTENRMDIDRAITRYFDTAYRGMSLQTDAKRAREREQVRRLIIGYEKVDERRVRQIAEQAADATEAEKLFTKVVFDPDFVNELRSEKLSLSTDINVLRVLDSSNIARRLYEVLNYFINQDILEFSLEIKELAHERLGISRTMAAPSQCWQKIAHAFEKLKKAGYLLTYDYKRLERRVEGSINPKFAPPHLKALPPLAAPDDLGSLVKQRFVELGAYPNAMANILKKLPEALLPDALFIAERIEKFRAEAANQGKNFKWGGWAYNELAQLAENGQVNPNLTDTKTHESDGGRETPDLSVAEPRQQTDAAASQLWSRIVAHLGQELEAQVVETWFGAGALTPLKTDGPTLIVEAVSHFVVEWISSTYKQNLQTALRSATTEESDHEWRLLMRVASPEVQPRIFHAGTTRPFIQSKQ